MGHILHDWDLPTKMLIEKAFDYSGGALTSAKPSSTRRSRTRWPEMSLNMLIETPGGFDYTV
jgi:hypothetical protein